MARSLLWQRKWVWRWIYRAIIAVVVLIVAVAGFFLYDRLAENEPVPMSARYQRADITPSNMLRAADSLYSHYQLDFQESDSGFQSQRLQKVAARLFSTAPAVIGEWRAVMGRSERSRLMGFPDGRIALDIGLVTMARNDAELAALLAHGMAHVIARHQNERFSEARIEDSLQEYVRNPERMQVLDREMVLLKAGLPGGDGHIEPFSRELEIEADRISQTLMARACYDPAAAAALWYWLRPENATSRDIAATKELLELHPQNLSRARIMSKQPESRFAADLAKCAQIERSQRAQPPLNIGL